MTLIITKTSTGINYSGSTKRPVIQVSLSRAATAQLGRDELYKMGSDEIDRVIRSSNKKITALFPQVFAQLRSEGQYWVADEPKISYSQREGNWTVSEGIGSRGLVIHVSVDVPADEQLLMMVRTNGQQIFEVATLMIKDTADLVNLGRGADGTAWVSLSSVWQSLLQISYKEWTVANGTITYSTEVRLDRASGTAFRLEKNYETYYTSGTLRFEEAK